MQQALSNVRKHAGAASAVVTLQQKDGRLIASVEDRGRGFERGRAGAEGRLHFGLGIMRKRAESVGGTLLVESRPGQGTRVTVDLPLRARPGS